MTELSPIELKMLSIIQEEHVTNVELAERLNIAPSPCLRRMQALKERGYIDKTVSILNRKRLGFEILAEVEVKVAHVAGRAVDEEFRRAAAAEPTVIGLYVIAGPFDFLLKVVATSMGAYAMYARKVLVRLPGVADMRSNFVLEILKESTALPLEIPRRQIR
jgi:Lrp/AsnC family transcriptional regulator, leucine-responsive regulatory protein